jgi:hypothetical protein
MIRYMYAAVTLGLISVAFPLRAANRPHAGTDSQKPVILTNDDLERLHRPGLISIVGQMDDETSPPASAPESYVETQDPAWYVEQSANLSEELERRRNQLDAYRQALEDARSLERTTGGISLDEGDIGITPEAGIDILQQRVSETQTELDALEDLARRNDVPPGTLRGQ